MNKLRRLLQTNCSYTCCLHCIKPRCGSVTLFEFELSSTHLKVFESGRVVHFGQADTTFRLTTRDRRVRSRQYSIKQNRNFASVLNFRANAWFALTGAQSKSCGLTRIAWKSSRLESNLLAKTASPCETAHLSYQLLFDSSHKNSDWREPCWYERDTFIVHHDKGYRFHITVSLSYSLCHQ